MALVEGPTAVMPTQSAQPVKRESFMRVLGAGTLARFAGAQASVSPPTLASGTVVQAKVVEHLGPRQWLVEVFGQPILLEGVLPLRPGQALSLRVATVAPKLTVEVASADVTGVPLSDSEELREALAARRTGTQQAAAGRSALVPELDTTRGAVLRPSGIGDGEAVRLSTIAQRLASLSGEIEHAAARVPVAVPAGSVRLDALADPVALAAQLKRAISESGYFYESHQALWAAGDFSLARLQREPQSRFATARRSGDASVAESERASHNSDPLLRTDAPAPLGTARTIVHAQIDAWLTHAVHWRAEPLPGQPIELIVAEEEHGALNVGDKTWRSTLRLTLPQLGEVEFVLSLSGAGIRLSCRAARSETAAALSHGQPALAAALDGRGLHMLGLTVERRDG